MYHSRSQDFIPIACHYDSNTLLTKNGELIQVIQIRGINSDKISKGLLNLRGAVRKAIQENFVRDDFAFWMHTIRRRANLDDNAPYSNYFAATVHDLWRHKNYWHDKFVNRLYVAVVYRAPMTRINSFQAFINSTSSDVVKDFEENFHKNALEKLNKSVIQMLQSLADHGPVRLGIREDSGEFYSDLMFLYRRIIQLDERPCLLPKSDLSLVLASHKYAVGSNAIEVAGHETKKFAAIMSIKEYQDVSAESLDKFLQTPVEMVATEVFYFVTQKEVVSAFDYQDYILKVSRDKQLRLLKGLDKVIDDSVHVGGYKHCHQQMSFMVISNNLTELEAKTLQASNALSSIGIVHVREDINLEKAFWAQLPGNFKFLSRISPTTLESVAALASLHNFPTGSQYNPWGRALSLLRTEKGTPYFANFHDEAGDSFTGIFGVNGSGRTILLNFLLSEADKYRPTVLHFVDDLDSSVYVRVRDGEWIDRPKGIINPFLVDDNDKNRSAVFEFLKIITNHHFDPLNEAQLVLVWQMVGDIFALETSARKLSVIASQLSEEDQDSINLKKRFAVYCQGGTYYEVFECDSGLRLNDAGYIAFNLSMFDDSEFIDTNFPKEKKLIDDFKYSLNTMRSVKAGIIYSASRVLIDRELKMPKLLALDDLFNLLNVEHYTWLIELLKDELRTNNGVMLVTLSLDVLKELYRGKIDLRCLKYISTQFILPPKVKISDLSLFLELDPIEDSKLADLVNLSRSFLIKQDGKAIAAELSIGGLQAVVRILSSKKVDIDKCNEIIKTTDGRSENWVKQLYKALDQAI